MKTALCSSGYNVREYIYFAILNTLFCSRLLEGKDSQKVFSSLSIYLFQCVVNNIWHYFICWSNWKWTNESQWNCIGYENRENATMTAIVRSHNSSWFVPQYFVVINQFHMFENKRLTFDYIFRFCFHGKILMVWIHVFFVTPESDHHWEMEITWNSCST